MTRYAHTVEDAKKIEIWWLLSDLDKNHQFKKREISWGDNGCRGSIGYEAYIYGEIESYVRLFYTQTDRDTGGKEDFDYKITLISTPCYFGGLRYWFQCPLCSQRSGVIYKNGDYFTCRDCANLTYESRRENRRSRYYNKFCSLRAGINAKLLSAKIKRPMYAGKITRKQRRVFELSDKFWEYNRREKECDDLYKAAMEMAVH